MIIIHRRQRSRGLPVLLKQLITDLILVVFVSIITIAAAEDDSSLNSILDLPIILLDDGSRENGYNQDDADLRVETHHRMLQGTDQTCTICADISNLRNDVVPAINSAYAIISFRGDNNDTVDRTCEEWESYLAMEGGEVTADYCLELRNWLMQQCCAGLPPLYECETFVEELLLNSEAPSYHNYRVPVAHGNALNVSVHLHVNHYEILDHGWKGGSVSVSGVLSMRWTDERLKWNNTLLGLNNNCATTSVRLRADDIFTPSLQVHTNHDEDHYLSSKVTVLSDGRVFWSQSIHNEAKCISTDKGGGGKMCSFALVDKDNEDRIKYNTLMNNYGENTGMVVHHSLNLPGYKFNKNQSTVLIRSGTFEDDGVNNEGEYIFTGMVAHEVKFQFDFGPLQKECNVCGYAEGVLVPNGTIPIYPIPWLEVFPDSEGWSCSEISNFLQQNVLTTENGCLQGQASFEEACCDDRVSSFECEHQIHDSLLENNIGDNTITPPDPSPLEHDLSFASEDAVDVQLNVDIQHIMGIDVKTNSMTIQLSLELKWYDPRLSWEPFVGGCHRASFRASLDRELTEIWVPRMELINMLQGVQDLPEADASVRFDGGVTWRRTGILIASCDLKGIKDFPFDTTGCYMDFGETRDPLSHRVNFVNGTVEFSQQVKDSAWNFQEYKTRLDKWENMEIYTEDLSGFENRVLRIHLYFDRAKNYYVHMFLLLYILFTYLSFGMFFIDYGLGERLGYGASILFVMVAQDITLSEVTPVTQEFLWIYRLSLGSKLFVIFGVVESIMLLWLYKRKDFGDEQQEVTLAHDVDSKGQECKDAVIDLEETRNFIDKEVPQNSFNDEHSQEQKCSKGQETSAPLMTDNIDSSRSWKSIILLPGQIFLSDFKIHEEDSERRKLIKRLRVADLACFFLFTITYTIVLICMYAII